MLDDAFSETVSLTRGGTTVTGISASGPPPANRVGRADDSLPGDEVLRKTWFIQRADYDFGAGPVDPLAGDVIEDADGDEWEVMPEGDQPAFRKWPGGVRWELNTKQVG